jgi:hypothetical protein
LQLALTASLTLSGCAFDEEIPGDEADVGDDEVGETSLASVVSNGISLNGISLNGISLNGISLNGISLNGISLNGISLNGTQLTGVNGDGQTISGTSFVGAKLKGNLSDGSELDMRIDSATTLPSPNTDVWAFGVSYHVSANTWTPLCGTSNGVPILAVPLSGTWNDGSGVNGGGSWTSSTTAFTFACRGNAIAKCVELGYKPWKTVSGVLLRNHHQACTRMIRADYCGDGKSWTTDGTPINIYDALGIQTDAATWPIDAEWTTSGARCINHTRTFGTQTGKPTCFSSKAGACGSFSYGALVIDEYKP